jgi:bacteriorhodopsin
VRVFKPSVGGTILVAVAFLLAIAVILGQLRFLGDAVPHGIFRWGTFAIALLFFLRAVGEFRLVGFFKRVSDTPFAYWDTWLFSPLCLGIAVIAFLLAYTEA